MDERYIAAVDLGSSKIALTVAKIEGEDIQILYYKERPSFGIRNSAVFNPQKSSAPIREAIAEAENELKIKIMQVVVGLPRCDIRQEISQATVERTNPDESITSEEVESLKSMAQDSYPLENPDKEELYGAIAQSFSDDENFQLIESDIIGVISRSLEGNFKLFIGKKSAVKTIDKVFNDIGVAIARKYFTPASAAKAVLTNDEMENGVALIDFGGGATSVTIYQGKIMRYYASIPFGGKVITSDIRTECSISEDLAENIKMAYGACMPDKLQTLGEKIIQIESDNYENFKQIPVKYLSEIITCRIKEIIDAMLYEIQRSGLADNLRNGIVITGGGANLGNISTYIKDLSGYNVRTGFPRHRFLASGFNNVYTTSSTTSLGMILSAKEDKHLNCIEYPETVSTMGGFTIEGKDSEHTSTTAEQHIDTEINTHIENSEEEEVQTNLFGEKDTVQEKSHKEEKKKKEKKPGLSVIWKKFVGDLYDNMNNESV